MSKLRYLALALALPLAVSGWWWSGRTTSEVRAASVVVPSTGPVAPGRVEPWRDPVQLAFEAQGRIVEVVVDEGDTVHAGQILARLDDRILRARVAAAEAALAQARARRALARRGPRPEELAAARADAEAAAVAARHRDAEQTRSERLGRAGALANAAIDADVAAARIATAQATAAAARYQSLAGGTRLEQLEDAAAVVALAQAELDAARIALDQTVLTAPRDGVILRRTAEVGALVTSSAPTPIVSLADLRQLEVRAEIDEADVAAITIGQPAYATAEAYGERKFPVVVSRVNRELGRKTVRDDDPRARVDTRVLEVIARFGAPSPALPLGLRMKIHFGAK